MHEPGLCEAVLATVERRAQGRPVAALRLRVGVLNRVSPDAFGQAFEFVAAGSVAQGCRLELVSVPVRATCSACGTAFGTEDPLPACLGCGSVLVAVTGGDELLVESLEHADAVAGTSTDEGS